MAESFLEAQLQRIRAWSARMSEVQPIAVEYRAGSGLSRTLRRNLGLDDESSVNNPLYDARDYRMLSSLDEERRDKEERAAAPEPPRRRRRRRR
ncbi:MAG TPA: hypothetical protein VGY57_14320 [Vicinamibacterales bacterium]|jgi:hypothetical protein|nr:hypothetical protein [Vicinamibacterales bacterium]